MEQYGETEDIPQALKAVRADVLYHSVDLATRKLVAGTDQFRQESVERIPVSCFAQRLLELDKTDANLTAVDIADAVAKCGFRRIEDPV